MNDTTITVDDLARHIDDLCHAHQVTQMTSTRNGRACRKARWIKVAPVRSYITYAVALHELGHVVGKKVGHTRLDSEVAAWQWAHANALVWTDSMDRKRSTCLASYVTWARRRQKRDPRGRTFITADHVVFRYIHTLALLATALPAT